MQPRPLLTCDIPISFVRYVDEPVVTITHIPGDELRARADISCGLCGFHECECIPEVDESYHEFEYRLAHLGSCCRLCGLIMPDANDLPHTGCSGVLQEEGIMASMVDVLKQTLMAQRAYRPQVSG